METISGSEPKKKSLLLAAAGCLTGVMAVIMAWTGLTSFLVGLAYCQNKGFWVPCLLGGFLFLTGVVVLFHGVGQTFRNVHRPPEPNDTL